jgi:hypothetical protein
MAAVRNKLSEALIKIQSTQMISFIKIGANRLCALTRLKVIINREASRVETALFKTGLINGLKIKQQYKYSL